MDDLLSDFVIIHNTPNYADRTSIYHYTENIKETEPIRISCNGDPYAGVIKDTNPIRISCIGAPYTTST